MGLLSFFFCFFSLSNYICVAERKRSRAVAKIQSSLKFKATIMHSPKFQTYSPKNQATEFEFYILCKGLNSGKPLTAPCPNSFVCICKNQKQRDFYFWLLFGLWKAKHFHQLLTGSVIPFIRIAEFKQEVSTQAAVVSTQESEYTATVDKIKQLEEREKNIRQQLALINDLKRAMIYRHLKSKM